MSRAELEHALARVLEEKEIRLKNNKLPLQPRCIERFTIPGVKAHWPVIFANALSEYHWVRSCDNSGLRSSHWQTVPFPAPASHRGSFPGNLEAVREGLPTTRDSRDDSRVSRFLATYVSIFGGISN
jgi:hypothetical protein